MQVLNACDLKKCERRHRRMPTATKLKIPVAWRLANGSMQRHVAVPGKLSRCALSLAVEGGVAQPGYHFFMFMMIEWTIS